MSPDANRLLSIVDDFSVNLWNFNQTTYKYTNMLNLTNSSTEETINYYYGSLDATPSFNKIAAGQPNNTIIIFNDIYTPNPYG
jgi:hypothetical protein